MPDILRTRSGWPPDRNECILFSSIAWGLPLIRFFLYRVLIRVVCARDIIRVHVLIGSISLVALSTKTRALSAWLPWVVSSVVLSVTSWSVIISKWGSSMTITSERVLTIWSVISRGCYWLCHLGILLACHSHYGWLIHYLLSAVWVWDRILLSLSLSVWQRWDLILRLVSWSLSLKLLLSRRIVSSQEFIFLKVIVTKIYLFILYSLYLFGGRSR